MYTFSKNYIHMSMTDDDTNYFQGSNPESTKKSPYEGYIFIHRWYT